MANDNETVEQLCADIKTRIDELWEQDLGAMLNGEVDEFADLIKAAHKREMASKDMEITELHNMIEELTDALHPFREWFNNQKLIDRAKEMIGLKEI